MQNNSSEQTNALPPPAPRDSPKARTMGRAARHHAIPFVVWVGIMFAVEIFHLGPAVAGEDEPYLGLVSLAGAYGWRTVLGAGAFLLLRPWRYYKALKRGNILPAVLLGLGVFLLWVSFESEWLGRMIPGLSSLYERWAVLPFGAAREAVAEPSPYAPAFCGWNLTLVRLAGSAFIIAPIEEFFWRGFLYRWIQSLDFLDIDPGRFDLKAFLIVAAIFGAAHTEWLAGVVTGVLYGYFFIRTRDIWATALAHTTTNLVLGLYVLNTGHYHFW